MKIGAHTSAAGKYENGLKDGQALGCETVQIFTSSPRRWAFRKFKKGEVESFHAVHEETGLDPVFSHANYLINIATPDAELMEKSKKALLEELRRVEVLGLDYVVLHPGSYKKSTRPKAVARVAKTLAWVFDQRPEGTGRILIENTAGAGKLLAHSFEGIRDILAAVPAKHADRVGVCFDTCHAFASGYDFRTRTAYDDLITRLDELVGLDRLFAFHLNDSQEGLGSKRDRHEHIGAGELGTAPFKFLLNDPRFRDHPGVLETNFTDEKDRAKKRANPYKCHKRNLEVLFGLRDGAGQ